MDPNLLAVPVTPERIALFMAEQRVAQVESVLFKMEQSLKELRKAYCGHMPSGDTKDVNSTTPLYVKRIADAIRRTEEQVENARFWQRALSTEVDHFRRFQDSVINVVREDGNSFRGYMEDMAQRLRQK